ncbi:MAG: methyl-accepting chemotaxis protein [Thermodesulfobacteriota bacterium]
MKIGTKIGLLTVLTVLVITVMSMLANFMSLRTNHEHHLRDLRTLLSNERKAQIRDLLSNAFSVASKASFYTDAVEALRDMRFGEDHKNSFLVFDKDFYCYVYPEKPDLENKIIKENRDADGNYLFQVILKTALETGEGYLEFREKGEETAEPVKKLMCFKYFPEWHWAICTSVNISDIDMVVAKQEKIMAEELNDQLIRSTIISLTVLILASFVGLLISRRIAAPLKKTSEMFQQIAQGSGDLTARLRVNGSYETGRLSQNFNMFLENQQAMIRDILVNAEVLNTSSSSLLTSSSKVSFETSETKRQSMEVSRNTDQVKSTVHTVAASMEQALTSIQRIREVSAEMNAGIGHVVRETEKALVVTKAAVRHSEEISDTVISLGKAADEINSITELITDISEQTNLLSLNATIEAARAGDTGRGFGVVAHEIKGLASKSNEAAGVISERIHDIQKISASTVNRINEIIRNIESVDPIISHISQSSEKQAMISSEILAGISQISSAMQSLTQSVAHSSLALEEIDREVEKIAGSSGTIHAESMSVESKANELHGISEKLRSGLTRFRI